jgi:hypothetical protein
LRRCDVCSGHGTIYQNIVEPPGDGDDPKVLARPHMEFEEAAANLLSFGTWAAVWYYGAQQTTLEWYWLFGAGAFSGILTYKLLCGPLRKLLTILKFLVIIGIVLAAIAFILKMVNGHS